jgi:hypothetical protein
MPVRRAISSFKAASDVAIAVGSWKVRSGAMTDEGQLLITNFRDTDNNTVAVTVVKQHGAAGIARRAHNIGYPEVPRSKRGAATFSCLLSSAKSKQQCLKHWYFDMYCKREF